MDPIVLPSSPSEDALVDAIETASAQGAQLQLGPGTHLTRRGQRNRIPIGANGLMIRPAQSPLAPSFVAPRIRRPAGAIEHETPDSNHGLYFVPAPPTDAELDDATWWHHDATGETFTIISRGRIRIQFVDLDPNMGEQGLEDLPKDSAEHSAMLGFSGDVHQRTVDGQARTVYVAFESVTVTDMVIRNSGYADDLWFSRAGDRGGFDPNVGPVSIARVRSTNRFSPRRSTIAVSGLCRTMNVSDCDLYRLQLEDTVRTPFDARPRRPGPFTRARLHLSRISMDALDLGATGQVYDVYGNGLHTRKECILHNAGGIIKDSDFHVASREDQPPLEGRRLICPAGLRFRRVSWTLHADEHGVCRGLKLEDHPDRTCIAYFVDNTFRADGPVTEGEVFTSSAGDPQNRVRMIAFGCHYERPFGESEATPIAVIDERGAWTFLLADLGGLDPEVAFRVTDRDNLALKVI